MLEVDWWNADVEKLQNPKPLPLAAVTRKWSDTLSQREKFCAFVVSNPSNDVRNRAFWWLNDRQKVDSAGRLFNNMGPDLFAGLGGGGGELKKHEFLKSYKYCFAYENNSAPGYTTEKLLHAKAAGCVPLYWGDPEVERDFDIRGFVDMRGVLTKEDFYAKLDKVEKSEEVWRAMLDVPALSEQKVAETRAHLRMVAGRIAEVARGAAVAGGNANIPPLKKNTIVFSTGFNLRFLNSFNIWTSSIESLQKHYPDLTFSGVAYAMNDISTQISENIEKRHPWLKIRRFPKEPLPDFEDWLAPEHYAWKLYIHNDLVSEKELFGATIYYVDTGAFVCNLPKEAMRLANEKGVCVVDDHTQKNLYWCHETFCEKLQVTEDEKKENQIIAGILVYIGGHPVAKQLFNTAWKYAQQRDIIVGKKWAGYHHDGHPTGHRHDQSIMSILSQRQSIPRVPLNTMYNDKTLREAYKSGAAFYVHRGNFVTHVPFARGISEINIINMARRADRMELFNKNHPDLKDHVTRFDAYDGRKVSLTPALARLFRPNDFKWKKAILGCALSHLELWLKLISDTKDIDSYLILEDDVKLNERWEETWEQASLHLPKDWDVIYLGGILPPNRAAFETVKEKVNEWFSRVAPNQVFGHGAPSRYFHFCNYSYILSKKGAQKVIDILKSKDGYWTSGDHMVCNNANTMNLYFLDPLVAGSYQDDDPAYQTSEFNNYNRIDTFDSDLWNNTDCFTEEEVESALAQNGSEGIKFGTALADARRTIAENINKKPRVIYTFKKETASAEYYEYKWLKSLFPSTVDPQICYLDPADAPPDTSKEPAIVLYQSQDFPVTIPALGEWSKRGVSFILVHISDEHGKDPLDVYSLPGCKHVIRNYSRPELAKFSNVTVLPLGPHAWRAPRADDGKRFLWSFYGTGWAERPEQLAPLSGIQPHSAQFFKTWRDAAQLKEEEYCKLMSQSIFVPCPRGNNLECFRFYEVLECGAIPVLVQQYESESLYSSYLKSKLPIQVHSSWVEAAQYMIKMLQAPSELQQYHISLLQAWTAWKKELAETLKQIF
jgi:GR25 family glycosyltransferase involved in LPS biosynthesis